MWGLPVAGWAGAPLAAVVQRVDRVAAMGGEVQVVQGGLVHDQHAWLLRDRAGDEHTYPRPAP